MSIYDINLRIVGVALFILSVFAIIVSSLLLLADITLTLKALEHEVKDYIKK